MNTKLFYSVAFCITALVACAAPSPTVTPAVPALIHLPTSVSSATAIPTPSPTTLSLAAVGDSIPYYSPLTCPGCTGPGFIDRYATAISKATGYPVKVQNFSSRGLQIDGLLDRIEYDRFLRAELANADIIVVAIAHNDVAWIRDDDPCDGPNDDKPDWSKYNSDCARAAAEVFRPKFERVYTQIVDLRAGKPTVFRTINRYNEWIGLPGQDFPSQAAVATRDILDAWNAMICKAAQAKGFVCADVYRTFNGSDGLAPADNLLLRDHVHPSDRGNQVIASILADLGFAPLAP